MSLQLDNLVEDREHVLRDDLQHVRVRVSVRVGLVRVRVGVRVRVRDRVRDDLQHAPHVSYQLCRVVLRDLG